MANDSGLFRTREELEADGWLLDGNVFRNGNSAYLPLYEGKMIHQFTHRWGDYGMLAPGESGHELPSIPEDLLAHAAYLPMPRYWVDAEEVNSRLGDRWSRSWLLGWRRISGTEKIRTLIATTFSRSAVGDSLFLALPGATPAAVACLAACLSSFVVDYVARQKIGGTNFNYYIFRQLPILPPASYDMAAPWDPRTSIASWVCWRVLELTYTAWDLKGFAGDFGYSGPPFRWDDERRALLRAELDACFFHLYGIERDDVDYILDTFPIVRRTDEAAHGEYRTKRLILECYDAMAKANSSGEPYRTVLVPPPADPAVAHFSQS